MRFKSLRSIVPTLLTIISIQNVLGDNFISTTFICCFDDRNSGNNFINNDMDDRSNRVDDEFISIIFIIYFHDHNSDNNFINNNMADGSDRINNNCDRILRLFCRILFLTKLNYREPETASILFAENLDLDNFTKILILKYWKNHISFLKLRIFLRIKSKDSLPNQCLASKLFYFFLNSSFLLFFSRPGSGLGPPPLDSVSDEEFLAYIQDKEPSYQASSPDEVNTRQHFYFPSPLCCYKFAFCVNIFADRISKMVRIGWFVGGEKDTYLHAIENAFKSNFKIYHPAAFSFYIGNETNGNYSEGKIFTELSCFISFEVPKLWHCKK